MPEENVPTTPTPNELLGTKLFNEVQAEPDSSEEDFKKVIRFAVRDIKAREKGLAKKKARLERLKGLSLEDFQEYIEKRRRKGFPY